MSPVLFPDSSRQSKTFYHIEHIQKSYLPVTMQLWRASSNLCKIKEVIRSPFEAKISGLSAETLPNLLFLYSMKQMTYSEFVNVFVCMAPWCNWLTRGPFKAESPGSSPGGATKLTS